MLLVIANGERTYLYTSLRKSSDDELDKFANRFIAAEGQLVYQVTSEEPEKRERDVLLNTIWY